MKHTVLLIFLFLLGFSSVVSSEELSIDYFIKHGDYLDLKISPDGEHFAVRLRKDGRIAILFIRRADGKVVGGAKSSENDELHSVTWVNNERVVYEYANKQIGLDRPVPTGELFATNIDGSGFKLVYGFRAGDAKLGSKFVTKENTYATQEIISLLKNDKKNILIVEHPWQMRGRYWYDDRTSLPKISRLNILTGRKRRIETIPYPGADVIADEYGNVNFVSWTNKQGYKRAAYREDQKGEWKEFDDAFDLSDSPTPIFFSSQMKKAYVYDAIGKKGLNTIYELDLVSKKKTPLFKDIKSDIEHWHADFDNNTPAIGLSYPDFANYHYLDASSRTSKIHQMLVKAFKGKNISITSKTEDSRLLVVKVTGDTDPGSFYLFDTESKKATYLWANRSWIDPTKMRTTEPFSLTVDDNVELQGYITMPTPEASVSPPMVVMVHGGPHGVRDWWDFDNEVQLLASRGYAVLQVNYRGSGGFGRVFTKKGYGEWGGKMIDDIVDATHWALSEKSINPERICVYGVSYGGYASLMSAVKAPDLFKCAIGYAGIYDLNMLYTDGDIPEFWFGEGYLELAIGRDEKILSSYSPANHADKIKANVMLIHGGKDERAPLKHAKVMRKQLKKAGNNPVWLHYGTGGHGIWDIENQRELYTGIIEFLENNIGSKN